MAKQYNAITKNKLIKSDLNNVNCSPCAWEMHHSVQSKTAAFNINSAKFLLYPDLSFYLSE